MNSVLFALVTYLCGYNAVTAVLRGEPAWDGIAEVWFDDIQSMRPNDGARARHT